MMQSEKDFHRYGGGGLRFNRDRDHMYKGQKEETKRMSVWSEERLPCLKLKLPVNRSNKQMR